jgi:hypothetical protein
MPPCLLLLHSTPRSIVELIVSTSSVCALVGEAREAVGKKWLEAELRDPAVARRSRVASQRRWCNLKKGSGFCWRNSSSSLVSLGFRVRYDLCTSLQFLALLGIRHVLDNRFLIALPLSPSSSISREVVSCIRFVLSRVISRFQNGLAFEVV